MLNFVVLLLGCCSRHFAFSSLSVFKQINKYIYPALIYFSLVFKQRWWRTDHFITETASCTLPLYPATHTNQTAAHCCRPSCLTETVAKPLLSITHSIWLPTADLRSISQLDFMSALLFLCLSVFFPPYSSQLYCVAGWLNLCCAFTVLNTSIGVVCAVVWFCFGVSCTFWTLLRVNLTLSQQLVNHTEWQHIFCRDYSAY